MPIKIKREVPEMERNNRVAMLSHLIEVLVISLLVFMQTAVGITSLAYAIIIFAIGMAPVNLFFGTRTTKLMQSST